MTNEWTEGPQLKNGRFRFGCTVFKNPFYGDRNTVIVGKVLFQNWYLHNTILDILFMK